jgi:hypothetical protein
MEGRGVTMRPIHRDPQGRSGSRIDSEDGGRYLGFSPKRDILSTHECPRNRVRYRATYEPGWRWSEHVGPTSGARRCTVAHVGLVVSGTATAALDDGRVFELRAGELFYIPQIPHDSWVVGNDPYVSLHFLGADHYAT